MADDCKIKDTSWIKPRQASWIYWAYNNSSNDFQIVKNYIDLAAEMKWDYCLIDWKWDSMQNGGDIYDAIKYAKDKNVKIMLWYNSSTALTNITPLFKLNSKENRKKEFDWLNENSISGIKIDFFDGDGAKMINYYLDLLEDAANHKLLLNFHGATLPRGWQRTYPNLMTVEAVYGAEWYNNLPVLTNRAAKHNVSLAFTRNVVGSMDYTPTTFSNSQHEHITTYAHELALSVLFESGILHMPDRPSAYKSLPEDVRNFLTNIPTAWDDTKFLSGLPESDVVIARRKANVWYIAGINGGNQKCSLKFNLKRLKAKGSELVIFKDADNAKSFSVEKINVKKNQGDIEVECLPMGGFTAILK